MARGGGGVGAVLVAWGRCGTAACGVTEAVIDMHGGAACSMDVARYGGGPGTLMPALARMAGVMR